MIKKLSELKPYKSLLLARVQSSEPVKDIVDNLLESHAKTDDTEELLENAVAVCRRSNWVKIWCESGHTIAEGHVFEIRHRDMPFQDFSWVDFSEYDVTKEKPSRLELNVIGEEDSLFCDLDLRIGTPILNFTEIFFA